MAVLRRFQVASSPARRLAVGVGAGAVAAAAVLSCLALASGSSSASFAAVAGPPGTPSARSDATIGYDAATKQVVMFGGMGPYGSLGDTWVFADLTWRQEHTSQAPAPRGDAAMAYDPKIRALVLFGGWATGNGADLDATWLWTGHAWERRSTATFPVGIDDQTVLQQDHMAYDAVSGKVVLVGIAGELEYQTCSAETWTFDGSTWQLQHPSTELPASETAIVNESQTGHVLAVLTARDAIDNVRGGQSCPVGSSQARALPTSSTWRWTGSDWIQVSTGSEPDLGVDGDAANGSLQSLQAVTGTSMLATGPNETLWSWNGGHWSRISGSAGGPPVTWASVQASDGDGVVVFGGSELPNGPDTAETWVWNAAQWRQVVSVGYAPPTPTPVPPSQNPDVVTPAAA
ncbi:MAG: hypothetical protein ABSC35_02055 [Candidatus Dormibacteria bacterium]